MRACGRAKGAVSHYKAANSALKLQIKVCPIRSSSLFVLHVRVTQEYLDMCVCVCVCLVIGITNKE